MSYASVAAHNAPPPTEQPHPDPALLYTPEDAAAAAETVSDVADDTAKVGTVSHDFKEHPATLTSEAPIIQQYATPPPPKTTTSHTPPKEKAQNAEAKAKKALHTAEGKAKEALDKAEDEGIYLWNLAQEYVLRPGVLGGLLGVVNLGLIGTTGYFYYIHPSLRRDPKTVGTTAAAAAALFGLQGWGAAEYRKTPAGQEEERKARKEGAVIYKHTREVVLRPGVLGGLVGVANLGILGTVGYLAYDNWNRPWDRRYVSAATVVLLALWGGEGYVAEQLHEGEIQLPKP